MYKRQTAFILFFIVFMAMVMAACRSKTEQTTPATPQTGEVAQEPEIAAGTQAAGTIVLVTLAATSTADEVEIMVTPTVDLAATATATAVSTPQAIEGDSSLLGEKFAAVQLDENGTAEIIITEAEMNEAITQAQTTAAQTGQSLRLQDPTVHFTGDNITLSGTILERGQVEMIAQPTIANGILQFEAISVTVAGTAVPAPILTMVEQTMNDTLSRALGQLPAGIDFESVVVGEGFMTLVAGAA